MLFKKVGGFKNGKYFATIFFKFKENLFLSYFRYVVLISKKEKKEKKKNCLVYSRQRSTNLDRFLGEIQNPKQVIRRTCCWLEWG